MPQNQTQIQPQSPTQVVSYGTVPTSTHAARPPAHRYSAAPPSSRQSRSSTIETASGYPDIHSGSGVGMGASSATGQSRGNNNNNGGSGGGGSLRTSTSLQFQARPSQSYNNDIESISSRSSYSTYSSSTGSSLHHLEQHPYHPDCCNDNGHVHGKCHRYNSDTEKEMSSTQLFWTYVILAPILGSILFLFVVLLQFLPSSTDSEWIVRWDQFGIGMLGWAIAFAARTPIFALVTKHITTDPDLSEWYTLLPAALVEESLRYALLTITITIGHTADFAAVYWLGLGWAGLETAYYIGQSLIYSKWAGGPSWPWYRPLEREQEQDQCLNRDLEHQGSSVPATTTPTGNYYRRASLDECDELLQRQHVISHLKTKHDSLVDNDTPEVQEVRHLLGIDRPWWSLMGRTSSMMVHIGLGCWLGHSGLTLLLPAAALHGALYIVWSVFIERWSVPATSYGTFMVAMGVFLIGLALFGEIV
ncbi:hypothetical protein BGZ94_009183 [Podila epigama]|nr:hypothetical protein BGZ94_009183 [Podila epigama]